MFRGENDGRELELSRNTESMRIDAAGRKVEAASIAPAFDVSDRFLDDNPLVSSLLSGAGDLGAQLEQLVRDESALQGIQLAKETQSRLSYARFVKPLLDRLIAGSALVFLFPLFILIALAVKLASRGPVLFVQQRTGYLGRRFALYKFRTMVENAEELKKDLLTDNIFSEDSPDFKLKKDPRITPIGLFLRKTSLDELPNLVNVFLGDMSLVGPRPTSFKATTYRKKHLSRLAATPGLTGLWQVSGRADVDFDERSELDAHYTRNMSFSTDLHIFCKTFTVVFSHRGAY